LIRKEVYEEDKMNWLKISKTFRLKSQALKRQRMYNKTGLNNRVYKVKDGYRVYTGGFRKGFELR